MSSELPLKKTVLHSRHVDLGALMSPFAGWEMPLWYPAGAVKEHLAVVTAAGLFDTSHMDVFFVCGDEAQAFLDHAFTRDLSGVRENRALYGAFLSKNGHCIDDAVLYPLGGGRFAIVSNAGIGSVLVKHLRSLPGADRLDIAEPTERLAKLDVQGPKAPAIVKAILADKTLFESFPYFSFKGDFDLTRTNVFVNGDMPVLLSRSGYTGEAGFEIFCSLSDAGTLWDTLLQVGAEVGIVTCGLAARDSLRTGAVLPLSHQDIGPWPFINHPWAFALPFAEDGGFTKAFVGSAALDPTKTEYTLPFVGFDQRRVESHDARVLLDGKDIGCVTTIVSDMAMGRLPDKSIMALSVADRPADWKPRGLACGFVRVSEKLAPGAGITLKDKRREIPVEIAADIRPGRTARKKLQ